MRRWPKSAGGIAGWKVSGGKSAYRCAIRRNQPFRTGIQGRLGAEGAADPAQPGHMIKNVPFFIPSVGVPFCETVTNALHLTHAHRAVRFCGKEHRLEAISLIGPHCLSIAETIVARAQHKELAVRQEVEFPLDIEAMLALGLNVENNVAPKVALKPHEYLRGKAGFLLNGFRSRKG